MGGYGRGEHEKQRDRGTGLIERGCMKLRMEIS